MVKSKQFIDDIKERQKAFLRTKTNLFKKSHELSVLCDVNLGVLIYCPPKSCLADDPSSNPVMVWPPHNPLLLQSLIQSHTKKSTDQENQLTESPSLEDDRLKNNLLVELDGTLENKIQQTHSRLQLLKDSCCRTLIKPASVEPDDAPLYVDPYYPVDLPASLFERGSNVSGDQPINPPPTPKYYDGAAVFNFQEVPAASYNNNTYDHGNMGLVTLLTQGEMPNNSCTVYRQPLQVIDQNCFLQNNRTSQLCGPAMRQPPQVVSTFAELMQH